MTPTVRLIATDLDGTFLTPGGVVSPLNAAAVRAAAQAGVGTVFATGRPYRWLQALSELSDTAPLAVASNGAVIWDLAAGQVQHSFGLPPSTAGVAAELRAELPDVVFAVEYDSGGWGAQPDYPLRGDFVAADLTTSDLSEMLAFRRAVKLLVFSPSLDTLRLYQGAQPIVADQLQLTYSMVLDHGLLELTAPGVTKASALRLILADRGIAAAELAAFGDMPNDLELLQLAGFPFAMANGHPDLAAAGFPIAPACSDDGVGKTIFDLLGSGGAAS